MIRIIILSSAIALFTHCRVFAGDALQGHGSPDADRASRDTTASDSVDNGKIHFPSRDSGILYAGDMIGAGDSSFTVDERDDTGNGDDVHRHNESSDDSYHHAYDTGTDGPYKKSTWFLLSVAGGYEKYFYYASNSPRDEAFSEIKSKVYPIDLLYLQLDASIPLFFFKTLYKYKRTEGGYVHDDEKNEYIDEMVEDPRLQYFLNVAAGFLGFEFGYGKQKFDFGTYDYFKSPEAPDEFNLGEPRKRDVFIGQSYYEVSKEQIDVKYHTMWFSIPQYGGVEQSGHGVDIFLGYRYVEYESPAILYTYTYDEEILCGESLPQELKSHIHMGGIGINNNNTPLSRGMNFILGLESYVGYGFTRANLNDAWYEPSYFPDDYNPEKDLNKKIEFLSWELGGNIGVILCLTNGILISSIKLEWSFEAYLNMEVEEGDYAYETGEYPFDVFHSLKASAQITF